MPNKSKRHALSEWAARIGQAVAKYVRQVAGGNEVSPQALANTHPDLSPESAADFKKAKLIGDACRKALEDGAPVAVADSSAGATPNYASSDGSPLHVRCPHCHNPVFIADETPWTNIVCSTCGSSFSLLRDTYATPMVKTIAHFELVEPLGTGAFGTVWKARDTQLDRTVAIKIPRDGRLATPELEQSFFREARAAAQLKHPGIVSVHEVGRQENTIYIVSDLVRGVSLSEWLSGSKPTARESAELCAKLADALHHAHEAGVVHRDLKPSNIMIDWEGEPHIMDFGVARRDAGEVTVTVYGQMLGTPAYMSPEQARGEAHEADGRSDVYSLGVILFQLLTGELPFRGHARMLLLQILRDEPPKPRSLKAGIPRDLQTICLKCLEKEPSGRYATAADLADDLRRFLRDEPIQARPIGKLARTWRWCKRNPARAALAATLSSVAIAAPIVAIVLATSNARIAAEESKANGERRAAIASLYRAYVGESQALRLARLPGYRQQCWQRLRDAIRLETPERNPDKLRQEAVLCLGDYRGRPPVDISSDPITITSSDHSITVAAIHRQAKWVAIGHTDGRIELYDPSSDKRILTIRPLGKSIKALSFTENGDRLLSVDASGWVCEYDIALAIRQKEPPGAIDLFHVDQGFETFGFALGGRYLVAHNKKSAVVWTTQNRGKIGPFEAPVGRLLVSVSLSPDEQWLAATHNDGSSPDRLMIWNFATKESQNDVPMDRGHGWKKALAFSHDSQLLAFGGEGLALHRMPTLDRYSQYPGDAIEALAFSPDNQLLAIVQIRGSVTLRSMVTNQRIATLPHLRGDTPYGGELVAFSADGRFLVSAMMSSVQIWNLRGGGERIVLPGHDDSVPTLSFSTDGLRLASGGKDETARIWNLAAGKLAGPPLPLPGKVQCLAFSPTAPWLATANWTTGDSSTSNLHLWNTGNFTIPTVVSHELGADVHCVTFSRDGQYLAACGNGMSLWRVEKADSADGEIKLTPVKHLAGKLSLFAQFSPKSNLLAWADNWENVRIWDIARESDITLDTKMDQGWHGLAFVGDEDLAFVTKSHTLEVWNARTNERQFPLGAPGEFLSPHIAMTVNGALLAAVDSTGSVALWDVRAKKKLFALRPEDSAVWSLAFDRTGTQLAVGLADGGVAVWDLSNIKRRLADLDLSWLGNQDE